MPLYHVVVKETNFHHHEIEATSKAAARRKVNELIEDGEALNPADVDSDDCTVVLVERAPQYQHVSGHHPAAPTPAP